MSSAIRPDQTSTEASVEEEALKHLFEFPLVDALFGRRSRRFLLGAEVPDGPLAHRSRYEPLPLTELERLIVLTAVSGTTGWHHGITRHDRYAPHLSNYPGAAGGRTFPSAAGFHTAQVFFTDDSGTYFVDTRDNAPLVSKGDDGRVNPVALIRSHAGNVRRLSDERLHIPPREPYMEGHNSWVANRPGSLLVIPVADLAQHTLLNLFFYAMNGFVIFDDVNHRAIPGLERFADRVDTANPYPLTFLDQYSFAEATAEVSTAAYAGQLVLHAMGLGGWIFNGIDRLTVLGASGDPDVPGLGFRYDTDERWALPNPTGLEGVFESFTPPHHASMRDAVEALVERKFGPGGPFYPGTPGPWRDNRTVRASAAPHEPWMRELVALQAQYLFDTFGKWPATVPSVQVLMYLQAHHLDLEYYDRLFAPGAYLRSHAEHLERWHGLRVEDLRRRE